MKLTEVPYILHLMIFPLGFLRMVLLGIFMIHSLRYISQLLLLGHGHNGVVHSVLSGDFACL